MYDELIDRLRNPYIIMHGTNIEEMMKSSADAIEYLLTENERMNAELERLKNCRHECNIVCLLDKYNDKCAELERVTRERDAPVVHGRWELVGEDKRGRGGNWHCSACNRLYPYKCDFCPNCGADMRGADNETD